MSPLRILFLDRLSRISHALSASSFFKGFERAFGRTSRPGEIHSIALGNAWAANTVNTAIFRHHGVLTFGGYQFTAFYVDEHTMRIVRRKLRNDALSISDIPSRYDLADAHNCISLGCDYEGYIHLAYASHTAPLRYRRSQVRLSVTSWTEEMPMTGGHESRVTYPCFLALPHIKSLLFLYRDGSSRSGTIRIKRWSSRSREWEDWSHAVISGALQPPPTSNPYWNHPAVGEDGTIHLSYVWRHPQTEGQINNVNIDYCKSPDGGITWYAFDGTHLDCPITRMNSNTIKKINSGENLINQCSMALDKLDRAHIVFYSNDSERIPQYQHLWFDGAIWRHSNITKREQPFRLVGDGTLQIPISRPEIVIDSERRVYVIYRGDLTDQRMVAQRLLPPDYIPDPDDVRTIWDDPLMYAEPVIDRTRWGKDTKLTMLVQRNLQPDGDGQTEAHHEPAYLVDIDLLGLWSG